MKKFINCIMAVFLITIWLKMTDEQFGNYDKHAFAHEKYIRVQMIKIMKRGVYFCRTDQCSQKDNNSWDGYIPDSCYLIIEKDNKTTCCYK